MRKPITNHFQNPQENQPVTVAWCGLRGKSLACLFRHADVELPGLTHVPQLSDMEVLGAWVAREKQPPRKDKTCDSMTIKPQSDVAPSSLWGWHGMFFACVCVYSYPTKIRHEQTNEGHSCFFAKLEKAFPSDRDNPASIPPNSKERPTPGRNRTTQCWDKAHAGKKQLCLPLNYHHQYDQSMMIIMIIIRTASSRIIFCSTGPSKQILKVQTHKTESAAQTARIVMPFGAAPNPDLGGCNF